MGDSFHYDDYMSDFDAGMWSVEQDPRLRSTILTIWILDRMPDEKRFEEVIREVVREVPRFGQRVVQDALGLGPPRWEDDPAFDLDFHMRRVDVGDDGSLRALLDLAQPVAMQAFDKDRPLWEIYLVGGMERGRAGVILKLHHAISDGVGMVRMTKNMMARDRQASLAPRPSMRARSREARPQLTDRELMSEAITHRVGQGTDQTRRLLGGALALVGDVARAPGEAIGRVRDWIGSLGRLAEPIEEPMSPLMRDRGMALGLRALSIPLEELKAGSKALGGTLNDGFLTAITGGLRLYHERMGEPVQELHATMPINVRSDDEEGRKAGNQFVSSRFLVPIAERDPSRRLNILRERVLGVRGEPALNSFGEVMGTLNRLPGGIMDRMVAGMLTSIDFAASNVPGPRRWTYLAGARIDQMIPFGPPAGAAINVTLFSYAGSCGVGINVDRAAVTDPELLEECLQAGFDEITELGERFLEETESRSE